MKAILASVIILMFASSCSSLRTKEASEKSLELTTNPTVDGIKVKIVFGAGESYYYPLIVFWVEDMDGKFIETLFAPKSIATGIFKYAETKQGKWVAGERRRKASLPYWSHRRNVKAPDGLYLPTPENPLPDAITGATPQKSFTLHTVLPSGRKQMRVLMEINQTWDWNNYWHNNKYPDDEEYKTSCQPALIYEAIINLESDATTFTFKPIGHSHPSGETGELFQDLSTFTSALKIADVVTLEIVRDQK